MTPTLSLALRALASVCDHASQQDAQGFNKFDAELGHKLADLPEAQWSPRQAYAAWKMLSKYRGQLARMGMDYSAIPAPQPMANGTGATAPRPAPPEPLPTGTIETDGTRFLVRFAYDPDLVHAIHGVPSAKWNAKEKMWTIPAERKVIEGLLSFATAQRFTWQADSLAKAKAVIEDADRSVKASQAKDASIDVQGLGGTLRPFQRAGVAYALGKERLWFADEMGLGKTVEALATVQAAGAFPALVICPASVKLNWVREAVTWLPGRKVTWLNGSGPGGIFTVKPEGRAAVHVMAGQLLGADVVVINYDLLTRWLEQLKQVKWGALVCDESHYAKNSRAQRTQAVLTLAQQGIKWRLLLTGTPLLNRPEELIAQLSIMGRLSDLGGWKHFTEHYCQAQRGRFGWDLSGAAHLEELNERLRALCYIRRTKSEVLTELPDKQWSVVPVDIDNRPEYERAEGDVVAFLMTQAREDLAFNESIRNLPGDAQQKARHSRAMEAGQRAARAEQLVRVGVLKRIAAQGKLKACQEWIGDFLESGKKLVAFAYHREIQHALLAGCPGAARIFGDDSATTREAEVRRFQTDDKCRVMIASLRAGREGITLTAASDVCFLEQGWTPAEHRQAEDRLHRIGQKDSVTCFYLLAQQTIDEDIRELIEAKRAVVDRATEGEAGEQADSILGELVSRMLKKGGAK